MSSNMSSLLSSRIFFDQDCFVATVLLHDEACQEYYDVTLPVDFRSPLDTSEYDYLERANASPMRDDHVTSLWSWCGGHAELTPDVRDFIEKDMLVACFESTPNNTDYWWQDNTRAYNARINAWIVEKALLHH
mmetsp:Transcript_73669/g.195973  ORF Transcript_73669/g.195973 Transcript_73669/m.195973 type:complete len:133 (-) Transcript_73669:6-404(-)